MNKDKIEIFHEKWKAGYRPGDELWTQEDQDVYDKLIALSLILTEDDDILRALVEYE